MANDTMALKQQQFSNTMLTLLREGKGGKLVEFTESDKNVEGETYYFYRMDASTTSSDIDIFAAGYTGTAGDTMRIPVVPVFTYSHDFKKEKDLKTTKIDVKSAYMKSFKNAVEFKEDQLIIAAIDGAATTARGAAATGLAEQFDDLVKSIAYAQALVKDNGEHGTNVAVAMNPIDYAELFAADKFASSDFFKISDVGTTLAGGKLIPTEAVPSGTTYIIPKNTVCFASWKGGDKAVMAYVEGKDGYAIWARKSVGAAVAEPSSIIKFSSKPGVGITRMTPTAPTTGFKM